MNASRFEYRIVISIFLLFIAVVSYYELRINYLNAEIRELRIEQKVSITQRNELYDSKIQINGKYDRLYSTLKDYFPEVYNKVAIKEILKDSTSIQLTNK